MSVDLIKKSINIGLTGLDGAGKSTLAVKLAKYLRESNRDCYVCEPKDDLVAQVSMSIARKNGFSHRDYFGAFPFELAKAFSVVRHNHSTIAPMLQSGIDVIEPRTNYCRWNLAAAHNTPDLEKLKEIYALTKPHDFLFYISVSPEVAHERVKNRAIDYEDLNDLKRFHFHLERNLPAEAIKINGEGSPDEVCRKVVDFIELKLK